MLCVLVQLLLRHHHMSLPKSNAPAEQMMGSTQAGPPHRARSPHGNELFPVLSLQRRLCSWARPAPPPPSPTETRRLYKRRVQIKAQPVPKGFPHHDGIIQKNRSNKSPACRVQREAPPPQLPPLTTWRGYPRG